LVLNWRSWEFLGSPDLRGLGNQPLPLLTLSVLSRYYRRPPGNLKAGSAGDRACIPEDHARFFSMLAWAAVAWMVHGVPNFNDT
jgi:hypothetical protein